MTDDDLSMTEARRRTERKQRESKDLYVKVGRLVLSMRQIQRENGLAPRMAKAYGARR